MSDVFISYSRRDIDFVRHLFDQLKARDVWVDWQDIQPTAYWWLDDIEFHPSVSGKKRGISV